MQCWSANAVLECFCSAGVLLQYWSAAAVFECCVSSRGWADEAMVDCCSVSSSYLSVTGVGGGSVAGVGGGSVTGVGGGSVTGVGGGNVAEWLLECVASALYVLNVGVTSYVGLLF